MPGVRGGNVGGGTDLSGMQAAKQVWAQAQILPEASDHGGTDLSVGI